MWFAKLFVIVYNCGLQNYWIQILLILEHVCISNLLTVLRFTDKHISDQADDHQCIHGHDAERSAEEASHYAANMTIQPPSNRKVLSIDIIIKGREKHGNRLPAFHVTLWQNVLLPLNVSQDNNEYILSTISLHMYLMTNVTLNK